MFNAETFVDSEDLSFCFKLTRLNPFLAGGTALLDLSGLDTSPQSPPSFPEFPTPTDSLNAPSQEMGISLLDDELMSLGNSMSDTTHR